MAQKRYSSSHAQKNGLTISLRLTITAITLFKKYRRILLLDDNYIVEVNYRKIYLFVHRLIPKRENFLKISSGNRDYWNQKVPKIF